MRNAGDRRLEVAALIGCVAIVAAAVSDFLVGSFWTRHALLASLLANILVVGVTVAVVNELLAHRSRRRWSVLAQAVLFELVQAARATWTSFVELLALGEVESGTTERLRAAAELASDRERVSAATMELLRDDERRQRLQEMTHGLSAHYGEVIANWAPVMVNAAPYAEVFDRHVELSGRLQWIASVLAHNEPTADQSGRHRRLTRSAVATEQAAEFDDERVHDMIVAIVQLAARLDTESRELAFEILSGDWWSERTAGLVEQ